MAIIRWKPWNLSSMLDEDWDLPTIPGITRLGQGLNLYETEDEVIAEAAVPGVNQDLVDVTVEDGVVRISGSCEDKSEEKSQRRYFMTSMASTYNYSFRLPDGITDEEPLAELENGVLTLKFKKVQRAAPKKIKVSKKERNK